MNNLGGATKYANVIFIQDADDFEEFERHAFPENPSPDHVERDAALEYLMQWEYGEAVEDEVFGTAQTEYPFCFQGHIGEQSIETATHVAYWNRSYRTAGLSRKIPEYVIDIAVTDNREMDDQSAHIYIHGVTTEKELIDASKYSGGPQVYITQDSHSAITAHVDAYGWSGLVRKLGRQFNLTGKARITWKHEGTGKPRGIDREFDI